MSPTRGRARVASRRLAAVSGALALGLVGLVLGSMAAPRPARAAEPDAAKIVVTGISPLIPTTGSTLTVTGTVRNTAGDVMRDVQARLRLSRSALGSRTELAAVAAGETTSRDGRVVDEVALAPLPAGAQAPYRLSVALDDVLADQDFGVYALSVEVRASQPAGFGRAGIVRTFLPWVPAKHDFATTSVTWLWPLQDRPRRGVDGTYSDDTLTATLSNEGRLGRLVGEGARLAAKVPLTWVVDPDLLDSASDMSASYQVRGSDGRRVPGTGSAQAAAWMAAVRSATSNGEVVALPYADPDVAALRRGGMIADVKRGWLLGSEVASRLLGRSVSTSTAWPVDGHSDAATLSGLAAAGASSVVLDAATVAPLLNLPYTPTGRAELSTRGGLVHGLLADDGLTAILARTDDPAGPVLQVQRFLAETAMITDQLPSRSRAMLVAPPRDWAPSALMLRRLVDALSAAPWLRASTLAELASTPAPEIDRAPLRYPPAAAQAELPRAYLLAVRHLETQLSTFADVLSAPAAIVPAYDQAVLRLESQAWRPGPSRDAALTATARSFESIQSKLRVLGGSYTFGSKSGAIPLTIDNELTQAVTVQVALRADNPRLRVRSVRAVLVEPNRKTQVVVPATSRANGRVTVTAQLLTPDGRPLGPPARLDVHITRYATLALLVTGGAFALLMGVAALRTIRRIRGRTRPVPAPVDPGERHEEPVAG